jgi:glycosyltransferase involved in cell wall biosynthesis
MIVFRHTPSGMRLGANLKVLFSFLVEHPDFERVDDPQCDVLLWRDPHARTVSAFFDKCRQAVNPDKVQNSQMVLLAELGTDDVTALLDLSFRDFVSILPRVRDVESHYRPQSHGLGSHSFDRIADIDHDLEALGRELGVDFSVRVNSTEHAEPNAYFDDETRSLIETLYADDFALVQRANGRPAQTTAPTKSHGRRKAYLRRIRALIVRWYRGPAVARPRMPAVEPTQDGQLSTVVLSMDAPASIVPAVRSLVEQVPATEVIVVNSGKAGVGLRLHDAGLEVTIIETSERLFPGAARNVGIAASHGEYVAFLAADCVAEPGWVAHRLAQHKRASLVATPVVNPDPWNPFAAAAHVLLFATRLPGSRPAERKFFGVSYKRELLTRHGGFRADLRTGEDTELHRRIGSRRRRRFAAGARTAHRHPQNLSGYLRDQFLRGRRAALAGISLGSPEAPTEISKSARRRWWRQFMMTLRATPGTQWPALFWAVPLLPLGAWTYARGARSALARGSNRPSHPKHDEMRLVCLLQVRNDAAYLPDYLANVAPQVDGIIALDDGSTDGSAGILAAHPKVVELIRVTSSSPHRWDEPRNRKLLTDAASRHRARWVVVVDADERMECDFRRRADRIIDQAEIDGSAVFLVVLRELWDRPDQYRADGIWANKRPLRLFRHRQDHQADERAFHGSWAPLNSYPDPGPIPIADLILYHLRMVDARDREARKQRYLALDPSSEFQSIGYEYLTDTTGLMLAFPPPGRDYRQSPEPSRRVRTTRRTLTVNIVSHRYGHFAAQAIESVLDQSLRPDVIRLSDDGVGDCRRLADLYPQVEFIEQPVNLGTPAHMQDLLNRTETDRCIMLGADNWLHPEALETLMAWPEDIVSYDLALCGEEAELFARDKGVTTRENGYLVWRFHRENIATTNYVHGSALFNVNLAKRFGYAASGGVNSEEDWVLWRAMLLEGGATHHHLALPLMHYRRHAGNHTWFPGRVMPVDQITRLGRAREIAR